MNLLLNPVKSRGVMLKRITPTLFEAKIQVENNVVSATHKIAADSEEEIERLANRIQLLSYASQMQINTVQLALNAASSDRELLLLDITIHQVC